MKKVFALILFVGLTLALSACGPNSQYYKLKTQTVYYYLNTDLVIDPYTFIEDKATNDWIKGISNEEFATIREDYRVEVEYRLLNSGDKYQSYDFAEENTNYQVIVENPATMFDELDLEEVKYEVKIHFINKETNDKKEMINYYGVFNMVQSDVNPKKAVVDLALYGRLDVLSNIMATLEEAQELSDAYQIEAVVTNEAGKTVDPDAKGGTQYTFMNKGTYKVTVSLTEILSSGDADSGDGDTDGDAGASEDSGEWGMLPTEPSVMFLSNVYLSTSEDATVNLGETFTVVYTIVVK
jgi:hypothetical protein